MDRVEGGANLSEPRLSVLMNAYYDLNSTPSILYIGRKWLNIYMVFIIWHNKVERIGQFNDAHMIYDPAEPEFRFE